MPFNNSNKFDELNKFGIDLKQHEPDLYEFDKFNKFTIYIYAI